MQMTITAAGNIVETDAIASGVFPPIQHVLIGDGAPHLDVDGATAMVNQVYATQVYAVVRESPQVLRLHVEIPQNIALTMREIGVRLQDGTLYAYCPYERIVGAAFVKPNLYAFSFSVVIARSSLVDVNVLYSPLDTATLSAQIAAQTLGQISDYNGRIVAAESAVSSLSVMVSAIEGGLDDLQGEVATDIAGIQSSVDAVVAQTASANTRLTAIEALVYAGL